MKYKVRGEQSVVEHLTAREKDVLKLLAEGYFNPEIAAQLFVAENTVRKHASRVYEKELYSKVVDGQK